MYPYEPQIIGLHTIHFIVESWCVYTVTINFEAKQYTTHNLNKYLMDQADKLTAESMAMWIRMMILQAYLMLAGTEWRLWDKSKAQWNTVSEYKLVQEYEKYIESKRERMN